MFFKHNNLYVNFFSHRNPKNHPCSSRFAVFVFQVNDLYGDIFPGLSDEFCNNLSYLTVVMGNLSYFCPIHNKTSCYDNNGQVERNPGNLEG